MRKKVNKELLACVLSLVIILQVLLGTGANVEAVSQGEYLTILSGGSYPCMYWGYSFSAIEQFTYLGEDAYYPAYRLIYDGNPVYRDRQTIFEGAMIEEEIKKIVRAGYPYHSYSDLGCTSDYPAYMATQLLILEYTQGEDLSNYRACDERGEEVEIAMQKIRNNLANIENISDQPNIQIQEETEWQIYEYDPNYYVKTMYFECEQPEMITEISMSTDTENGIRILDENNIDRQIFSIDERWKILRPVQENEKDLSIVATTVVKTYPMGLASSTDNGEAFILTKNPFETMQITYEEQVIEKENEKEETTETEDEPKEEEGNEQKEEETESEEETMDESITEQEEEKEIQQTNQNENQSNISNEGTNESTNINENKSEQTNNMISKNENVNENANINQNGNQQIVQVTVKEEWQINPQIQIVWNKELQEDFEKFEENERKVQEDLNLSSKEKSVTEGTKDKEGQSEEMEKKLIEIGENKPLEILQENSLKTTDTDETKVQISAVKKLPRTGY